MYKITIIKTERTTRKGQEWQRLRDSYPDEENRNIRNLANKSDPQYGYVEADITRELEDKIYEQNIDEINLKDIIKAINP